MTSTSLAASTSSALTKAGSDSACVSLPRNSGPLMPRLLRYSQIACVMARICASLKVPRKRRAAMAAGAEAHPLRTVGHVGLARGVRVAQRTDIGEKASWGGSAGQWMDRHGVTSRLSSSGSAGSDCSSNCRARGLEPPGFQMTSPTRYGSRYFPYDTYGPRNGGTAIFRQALFLLVSRVAPLQRGLGAQPVLAVRADQRDRLRRRRRSAEC